MLGEEMVRLHYYRCLGGPFIDRAGYLFYRARNRCNHRGVTLGPLRVASPLFDPQPFESRETVLPRLCRILG